MNRILILLTSLFFAGESFALPPCPTSGYWDNCYGAYTFEPTGNKYVGGWKDNKMHGQGTHTSVDGAKYVGEYKANKKHGQGTFTIANGDKYAGEWKDGNHNGQGTFTYGNGNKYVGEWKDGKRHGEGIHTFTDGEEDIGEFKFDKPWNVVVYRSGKFLLSFKNGVPQ